MLSNKNIVELESNYEPVTKIGYNFRVKKYVYPYFVKKGFNVIPFFDRDAIRAKFAPECMFADTIYISGFGHGNTNVFTGQDHDVIWKVGSYDPQEVKDKIIHLLSCLTAVELGYDLVKNGARAYFGYKYEFIFYNRGTPDPLDDVVADAFFECDSLIDRLIADGLTAGQIFDAAKELFAKKRDEYMAIDTNVASAFIQDLEGLQLYGDPNACLPNIDIQELDLNKPVTGNLEGNNDNKKFIIKNVDEGNKLLVSLDGPDGADFDVYVKFGSPATIKDFDIRGYTSKPDEKAVIYPTKKGDYYIMVNSYKGSGEYTLETSLEPRIVELEPLVVS